MKHFVSALVTKLNTTKLGVGLLAGLSGATALAVLPYGRIFDFGPGAGPTPVVESDGHVRTDDLGVKITTRQSHGKVVQGYGDEVYLEIDVDVPAVARPTHSKRQPTDLVLVLDRSGSMGDGDKIGYAKAAMRSFAESLGEEDRIALVTFDDAARTDFPLSHLGGASRSRLLQLIDSMYPGNSTNISDGLERGHSLVSLPRQGRNARVVLLSDGMPTSGDTSTTGLVALVKRIAGAGTVVSTIGMGLDFNEQLLASLSDHGMGNYTYIETLTNLAKALEKDLEDARAQFAGTSRLHLTVGDGVLVTDAGGYPIERNAAGGVTIPLGQLLEGSKKTLTISLRAPTHVIGDRRLAGVELAYERAGAPRKLAASDKPFSITVVEPSRAAEAMASLDAGVVKNTWISNNAGRMKKEFSEHLRQGRKEDAEKTLDHYRAQLGAVSAATGISMKDEELESELKALGDQAKAAFEGSPTEQATKQKAFSKGAYSSALKSQRTKKEVKP
jgi:Ca-activated chloride channel family protein